MDVVEVRTQPVIHLVEVPTQQVVEIQQMQIVELVELGTIGPMGPSGPPGESFQGGTSRWHGDGPPEVVVGAKVGDEYVDNETGNLYVLR